MDNLRLALMYVTPSVWWSQNTPAEIACVGNNACIVTRSMKPEMGCRWAEILESVGRLWTCQDHDYERLKKKKIPLAEVLILILISLN